VTTFGFGHGREPIGQRADDTYSAGREPLAQKRTAAGRTFHLLSLVLHDLLLIVIEPIEKRTGSGPNAV
jgi:hypothetical protein